MKKVLLATSALVLTAGVAAAEVSVGGDGRMGVVSTEGGDLNFTSRMRVSFAGSGETDGGLTFGGSIRLDHQDSVCSIIDYNDDGTIDATDVSDADTDGDINAATSCSDTGASNGSAGSVFVEGAFGKISMGDVSGAPEAAVGDLSGVGLTGLGDHNEMKYLSNSDRPAMRYDYSAGDLGFHVSADNPGPSGDQAYGVAVTYGMGDISFGLGYEDDSSNSQVIAGVTAGFGDATVKAIYGSFDDDTDQYGVSLDYGFGATTVTAYWRQDPAEDAYYGVGVSHDLGGGASLVGGVADGDAMSDASYDFGLSMKF